MVKSSLLASAALVVLAGSALAADLPMRSAPPAPFIPAPIFTWTGPYFGINGGYAFDNVARARGTVSGLGTVTVPNKSDGFVAGGQVGYNYQFGAGNGIVVGIEADADYTDLSHRLVRSFNVPGTVAGVTVPAALVGTDTINTKAGLDYLGTIRGRVGYAYDQFLIYGTGGFAYGGLSGSGSITNAAGRVLGSASGDTFGTGWAAGGGIEYAVPTNSYLSFLNFFHSSAVTVKAEYLHYDLDGG